MPFEDHDRPMWPSPALAQIVGERALRREEIVKIVWEYIQARGLQDEASRRYVHADPLLLEVLGGAKTVTVFDLAGALNRNLRASREEAAEVTPADVARGAGPMRERCFPSRALGRIVGAGPIETTLVFERVMLHLHEAGRAPVPGQPIALDGPLQGVFGQPTIEMRELPRALLEHLTPFSRASEVGRLQTGQVRWPEERRRWPISSGQLPPAEPIDAGAIAAHLAEHLGCACAATFTSGLDGPAPDVCVFPPSGERAWTTLVTLGLSGFQMPARDRYGEWGADGARAELIAHLPPDWQPPTAMSDAPERVWPVRMLRDFVVYALAAGVRLKSRDNLPNVSSEPPGAPFLEGSALTDAILLELGADDEPFLNLRVDGENIHFLTVVPLTSAECAYKVEHRFKGLEQFLISGAIPITIDVGRRSAV